MAEHPHDTEQDNAWVNGMWHSFLSGEPYDYSAFPLVPRVWLRLSHALFHLVPSNPRCRDCKAPFGGIGGAIFGRFGYKPSDMTPRLCNACVTAVKQMQGGAEIELSMLFADVRGSTALAEQVGPTEFKLLINRFYNATTDVLIRGNALIDRLQGDEVIGLFLPGFAGHDHAAFALEAAQDLLRVTGHADPDGPWISVGAGVHTGVAYVGAVGSPNGLTDITALGDAVNTAARLASKAAPGEIIVSTDTLRAAGVDAEGLEPRQLELKGKSQPFDARVIHVRPVEDKSELGQGV